MKRKIAAIVKNLTDDEIQEIINFRRSNDKKIVALRAKRDKLAAQLADIEATLAQFGDAAAEPVRRGRKPGRKPGPRPGRKPGRKPGPRKGATRGRRLNLSAAVREVFEKAQGPLKASQVVDGLPKAGIKVKDVSDMRKRVSVVLASQKNRFEHVDRGVYQLKAKD